MCNFHGYNNARSRRNERRRAKQEAYNRNKTLNMALKVALNPTKQSNQQIISKPKRPLVSLKRNVMRRVELALLFSRTKIYDAFNNYCLPKVALYSVKNQRRRHLFGLREMTAKV
ncbi:hypothetical protein ARAF_0721 [Arsenophonus endosymbiont of Aleurodicus floccissimus]|uniref:transcriptional antitermination N peptide n=1 Tax=Arsenophonus endosymbiont of Aleurodicus floccissimus TaxID=2152761 RepID=UPI000E6AFC6C|nr:hypothetical protein [Arsenophonus endosymbiont of Aleurodicus floccissimus]SPP31587.1 hypothetical protein ARAF_0721 [Arsenophonus endosymbiont of Aleurodicus floccissimus]